MIRRAWTGWMMLLSVCVWLGACGDDRKNCYQTGECECMEKAHCPEGTECVDGSCQQLVAPPPPKREFGEPCTRDSDCRSNHCLPRGPGNGGVCTRSCEEQGCPEGWECKTNLPRDGSGPVALCVQRVEDKLCHTCSVDGQCNAIGDLCVDLDEERVCALDCSREDCPAGYVCTPLELPAGTARQCLPQGGSCACSEATLGLTRSCTTDNAFGSCHGHQTCEETGGDLPPDWSVCDAPAPAPEVCNGEDDDCDGLTDAEDPGIDTSMLPGEPPYPACRKGSALGACIGVWACQPVEDGAWDWVCAATDPEDEVCNGRDDNCDGIADDPFVDEAGRYVHTENCGGCGSDCRTLVPGLLRGPAGEVVAGAVGCTVRGGQPVCVPAQCEPGRYPYPESAPVTCAELVSPACQPCTQNADCRVSSDICAPVDDDPGAYCLQSCAPVSPYAGCTGQTGSRGCCPEGYLCIPAHGGLYCLPEAGSCTCSPERAGVTRTCLLTGAGGEMCQGLETCEQDPQGDFAWSGCAPSDVVVEVCDLLDNNCDGQVDEGFVDEHGAYVTDAHCGVCNNNCLARWDQEIQHAIGGCVEEEEGLTCRIVACASEDLAGWGPCREDDDCIPGTYCDPDNHHCINPNPGECPGGFCGTPCEDDQDCVHDYGPGYVCDPATNGCLVPIQYADTNREEADGCECAATSEAPTDEPDIAFVYPGPGEAYVDRDCDGIDGVAGRSLFVWAGTDQSLGTREHPYATIGEALDAFDPAQHEAVLVAAGIYAENIELRAGVGLYGGYAPGFARRDVVLYPTVIQGNEPDPEDATARPGTVYAGGITTGRTVLAGFTIRGYDVNADPIPGGAGANSYALYLRDCDDSLVIANNVIVGGRGGDGADGAPGVSGTTGQDGADGQDSWECPQSQDCFGYERAGGAGGQNVSCPSAAGNPGATANDTSVDPQDYQGGGINGSGGTNSTYGHSDPSQADYCKYDCQVAAGPGMSCNGGDAQPGPDGAAGAGGTGCSGGGSLSGGHWRAVQAAPGGAGGAGSGGGGGGAGGAVFNNNAWTGCTVGEPWGDLGASGGGGGAGGCGASGGGAGGGGGGSFGVFLVHTAGGGAAPAVFANRIRRGIGGDGGNGGGGGQGGLGGQGGAGGEVVLPAWCAGTGGRGGRGGDGGAGGGGGGGCGGISYGLFTNHPDGAQAASIHDNQWEAPGHGSTGGAGGQGGSSPAGTTHAGADGQPGTSGDVLEQ